MPISPGIRAPQIRLLQTLCDARGVSGQEGEVRKIVKERLAGYADSIEIDPLGNVLATRKGRRRGRLRVMLAAHMDEVGLIITGNDKPGIYRFETVGGLSASQLVGKAVNAGKAGLPGVIGFKPIHLSSTSERGSSVSLDSLRIDTGGAGAKIKPGEQATFSPNFTLLGRGRSRVMRSKAMDDRLGVATLLELLRHAPPNIDLLAAFTTQEEIGVRGARVAAHALDPDVAIVLDCTPARDLPHWNGEENTRFNARLGAGPAIYIADRGTLSDPRLVRHLARAGEEAGIPFQYRQAGGGGTDAGAIHKARAGIPTVSLSVPGRYLHTAASLVSLSDWRNSFRLLLEALSRFEAGFLKAERV